MQKTNYDILKEDLLKDSEFAAYYAFSKEKLSIELLLDDIKESVKKDNAKTTTLRKIRNLSRHIGQIAI